MVLKKELSLYDRDEQGKLIPKEVPLIMAPRDEINYPEYVGQTICITPLPRGELSKVFGLTGKVDETAPETDKDGDAELIDKHCKNPKYSKDELPYIKPVMVRSIVRTILSESGVKFDDKFGTKKIEDDELGKNSAVLNEKEKKGV